MPRAMWSGAISFGLVNIPVKLYKATASTSGNRSRFTRSTSRAARASSHIRWCPKDEVEVPWDEVAKGYEFEKGKYVEVSDDELDALLPEEDYATVAIENFVALDDVDPIYYDRAYYISPDGSPKAYALLHETLAKTGKVAVARVFLRTRSHLALVRVLENHLLLETMYFDAEIVDASEVPGVQGKAAHVDSKQLEVAEQLVESMTIDVAARSLQGRVLGQGQARHRAEDRRRRGRRVAGAPRPKAAAPGRRSPRGAAQERRRDQGARQEASGDARRRRRPASAAEVRAAQWPSQEDAARGASRPSRQEARPQARS